MIDAYMLLSYGDSDKPEDVIAFLRHAVAGRGIPNERLAHVGEHYYRFGGPHEADSSLCRIRFPQR